jgi:dihydroflavonol-4-reductase
MGAPQLSTLAELQKIEHHHRAVRAGITHGAYLIGLGVEGVIDEAVPQAGATSWVAYERSKWAGEQAVRRSALPWVVLNPSHILGPGDRRNWARPIMMIDRGTLPGVPPGAGSFADVREVARAHVQAWQRGRFGQGYLLGGEQASFVDFARRVGQRLGRRTPARPLPRWLLMGIAHARAMPGAG